MTRPPMLTSPLHFVTNGACAYEAFSLSTGLVPPISAIGARHRVVKIVVVCGALGIHLWRQGRA